MVGVVIGLPPTLGGFAQDRHARLHFIHHMRVDNAPRRRVRFLSHMMLRPLRSATALLLVSALLLLSTPLGKVHLSVTPASFSHMVARVPVKRGSDHDRRDSTWLLGTSDSTATTATSGDWQKARPITNGRYPAKDLCRCTSSDLKNSCAARSPLEGCSHIFAVLAAAAVESATVSSSPKSRKHALSSKMACPR
eukprot:2202714-Rhodomonas_salina.2